MLKKSGRISVIISIAFGILVLLALAFLVYWIPDVVPSLIEIDDHMGNRQDITDGGKLFVIIDAYLMVAVAAAAVILLFLLLRVVLREHVFSTSTTRLLSAISWCCFAEALLSALLIIYFQLAICFTFAACFLGLCLRVVRHVINEATRIKAENDFTI